MEPLQPSAFSVQPSFAPARAPADCWQRIGVEGNGTCRELAKYVHCRNCPVYTAAGLELLDRPLTAEYRRECTEHYGRAKETTQPTRLSVVLFRLAEEWLALPTTVFQEVAERRALHTLPHRRRGGLHGQCLALGLVNVRGELLVCASAARLIGLKEVSEARDQGTGRGKALTAAGVPRTTGRVVFDRLLVASWHGQRVAFPVAEVFGIQRFAKVELKAPPATISKSALTYTQGVFTWRDRTVGLLDAEVFFSTLNRSLS